MKRTISILVIIAMLLASVLAIIPVGAAEGAEGGDTVVEDTTPVGTPVATADEFKAAVEAGKDFYLTDSITLPADWAAKDFGATMDGNEKTITLSGTAGLFATLNGATIKNVAVLGEELTDGIAKGATGAVRFENVTSMVKTVKGNDNAAAFVSGQNKPASITFIKCTNMTNVVGGLTGGAFGGWIQAGDLVFEDCANLGSVEAKYAGGYVGAPQNANVTVKNCIFNATKKGYAGAVDNVNWPCAAIEIDNYGNGVNLVTEGNTYDAANFSGEWRIKSYNPAKPDVIVNGVEYTKTAVDGRYFTVTNAGAWNVSFDGEAEWD